MPSSPCSCEYCTQNRRMETRRLLEQEPPTGTWGLASVAAAILLPALVLIGILAAWLVGR